MIPADLTAEVRSKSGELRSSSAQRLRPAFGRFASALPTPVCRLSCMPLNNGEVFAGYTILGLLGTGGMGVLDRGEFNGRLWISMDYVDGADAGRLIRQSYPGGMPERDVAEIVTAVADALDFGHEHRLLDRDVKPENTLVTASDSVGAGCSKPTALAATTFHLLTGAPPFHSNRAVVISQHLSTPPR